MRVSVLQHDIVWEDAAATRAHLEPQVAAAAAGGARLIVLTEMFATGFSMNVERTAESIDGPTVTWMFEQAVRHDACIAGSLAVRDPDGGRPTNGLVLAGPDGTMHRYDKIHPFTYGGEHERFGSGSDDVMVELDGVRWHLSVCYDLRFADQYWRAAPDVDAYLVVANWPTPRRAHWRALLQARAIENQAFVVASNRVGSGGGRLEYSGDSRIIDPMGEVLAGGAGVETILTAEIDPAVVAEVRERFPFFLDR